jgi:LytS/YehU family sensor histidine kinase
VKHGIERRTEGGAVVVEGTRDGNSLVLRVRNDAPNDPALLASAASGSGVGVRNTRARLEQLYGSEQRFTLARDGEHVVAEIRLPYHVSGLAEAADAAARAASGEQRPELAGGVARAG